MSVNLTLIRNATIILEIEGHRILIDPMLGRRGRMIPFSFIRETAHRNPTVDLPKNTSEHLKEIDFVLITHCQRGHKDHLDAPGVRFLIKNNLSVWCHPRDLKYLKAKGLRVDSIQRGLPEESKLKVRTVDARHGHGFIGTLMGPGSGYLFETESGFKVYVIGDSVLTPEVEQVLTKDKPDIVVINAGGARMDFGSAILMTMAEISRTIELSQGKVVAVHLEALNHCPITRADMRMKFRESIQEKKVYIPEDGETLRFN